MTFWGSKYDNIYGVCSPLYVLLIGMIIVSQNLAGVRQVGKLQVYCESLSFDILCMQECKWSMDVVRGVREFWKGEVYHNYAGNGKGGVAVLVSDSMVGCVKQVYADADGRMLVLDIECGGLGIRLINVYAPNGEVDRKAFFKRCVRWFTGRMVVCGDFNMVLTPTDVGRYNVFKRDISRACVKRWMAEEGLVDAWRGLKGGCRAFSRRQVVQQQLKQSRIDLCLMSGPLVRLLSQCTYDFKGSSDHAALTVTWAFTGAGRNGGTWCFNNALLRDELFMSRMKSFVTVLEDECAFVEDVAGWWEEAKCRIKKRAISWGAERRRRERATEAALRAQLEAAVQQVESGDEAQLPEVLCLRQRLSLLLDEKLRGALIRSRAQHMLEGERCTAFFCGLEKHRQTKAHISGLVGQDGQLHTDLVGILETAQAFYESLFTCVNVDSESVTVMLDGVTARLDAAEAASCEDVIALSEVGAAIDRMNGGKSPGMDGLTAEFYRAFKSIMSPILLKLYCYMEDTGHCTALFARGIISVLFKRKGKREDLANYRPISLLNVDYKILASILNERLKGVVGTVLGPAQSYGVPRRDIMDCTLSIKCSLAKLLEEGGLYLKLDLEKAFDNVSHRFLFQMLRVLGFGPRFCGWIQLLYGCATSVVKCNGSLSDPFEIRKSVRQGCPLSAVLYAVTTEPLVQAILKDSRIRGIRSPGLTEFKLALYADDVNVMVRGEDSCETVLHHLSIYERASGARVNRAKSCVMAGPGEAVPQAAADFKREGGPVKVLGLYMGGDPAVCVERVWREQVAWCRTMLYGWRQRVLGIRGRVLVINAIMIPKLVYTLQVCPVPDWVFPAVGALIRSFLWKTKALAIAHATMIGPVEQGGLRLVDLRLKVNSLRLKLLSRMLDDSTSDVWQDYLRENILQRGECGMFNLCSTVLADKRWPGDPLFQEVAEAWVSVLPFVRFVATGAADVLAQPLFGNPWLGGRRVLLPRGGALQQCLAMLGQVVDGMGRVNAAAAWQRVSTHRVQVARRCVTHLCRVVDRVLCDEWRVLLGMVGGARVGCVRFACGDAEVAQVRPKVWYRLLVAGRVKPATALAAWSRRFVGHDMSSVWKSLKTPWIPPTLFHTSFMLMHRRVFTSVVLHQIHHDVFDRVCAICGVEDEDFDHLLLDCADAVAFRDWVRAVLEQMCGVVGLGGQQWEWAWCFGLPATVPGAHARVAELVLLCARHVLLVTRQRALFDGQQVCRRAVFKNLLRFYLSVMLSRGREGFEAQWCKGNRLVKVERGGVLVLDFG